MKHDVFDAVSRLLARSGTRRGTAAALLGAALIARHPDSVPAGRRKRRSQRTSDVQPDANAQSRCRSGAKCVPGPGRTNARCDFSGSSAFFDRDVHGAVLSGANFTMASAPGADFRGAVLSGACFVNAILIDAKIDATTVLDDAVFCGTVMPDGSIDDSGCSRAQSCCVASAPDANEPGGPQSCADTLIGAGCAFVNRGGISWACQGAQTNLEGANLGSCDLSQSDLRYVRLRHAILDGADLTGTNLTRADLSNASLRQATLNVAGLVGTILRDADLTGADMREGGILVKADLNGADLTGLRWGTRKTWCPDGVTVFGESCCAHLNGAVPRAGC